jgi:hypothetical protein
MEDIKKSRIKNIKYKDNYCQIENDIVSDLNSIYVDENLKKQNESKIMNYFFDLFNKSEVDRNKKNIEPKLNSIKSDSTISFIKSDEPVSIIKNYLDKSNISNESLAKIEPKTIDTKLTKSVKFFDCFDEENNINNVVSCEEESEENINNAIFIDNKSDLNQDYDNYEIGLNNDKIKNKNQKNINRFGVVAISTFLVMSSAWMSRFV